MLPTTLLSSESERSNGICILHLAWLIQLFDSVPFHMHSRVLCLVPVALFRKQQPVHPFPPVDTVAAPCGSPAVLHLHRYYGLIRLLTTRACASGFPWQQETPY